MTEKNWRTGTYKYVLFSSSCSSSVFNPASLTIRSATEWQAEHYMCSCWIAHAEYEMARRCNLNFCLRLNSLYQTAWNETNTDE